MAAWKDGSEQFFYGRLNGAGIVDKEDKYRCFVSIKLHLYLLGLVADLSYNELYIKLHNKSLINA